MMNRRSLNFLLTICVIFGVWMVLAVGQAQASLIGPNRGPVGDKNYDAAFFSDIAGTTIIELDRDEFDDGVPDVDTESYLHVDINDTDDKVADVSWDLNGTGLEAWYVAVKDGDPSGDGVYWVWYEVSATTTDYQRIIGGGIVDTYANGAGAISNITLYGNGTSVPDASIMFLLGPALIAFGVFSRKSKKS